ncbi:isocitrate lyase [Devosia sp. MC532]|uniref:isocitrate lyase n=1 Tax=Devosia sp. MC532 TaxID=2799788 RepID=UPI0018F29DB4|nr:isocitrate lyase [Devosia sp. MC532]MBJ7579089.1 isocitrate lyase [Devosia sp. MC532]
MLDKPHKPEQFPAPDYAPNRWDNIARSYTRSDVARLSGSLPIRHTLAENGAKRLWELLQKEDYVPTLGTFTGNQAVQQVKAGIKAIYLSGWQVAADANSSGHMYPDQSLYPVDSVPSVVRRINKALQRADQIQTMEQSDGISTTDLDFFVPIIADAEAGFGGPLNVFELMKAMIEAGAAAVHFEDQLASEKKCGHLGGKVLVPTSQFIRTLNAARLAADVMDVPTLIMARTDAEAARLITSNIDEYDAPFVSDERTAEGFYVLKGGIDAAIARGIAYAPFADLIWCETSTPSLDEARKFAESVRKVHPNQMLAYNCSPSFNWAKHMGESAMASFQREIAAMGYKYQFITLAGFHNLSLTTFNLTRDYLADGMAGYSRLQQAEFAAEKHGFSAVRHQREVGTGYFDAVSMAVSGGKSATTAMAASTETAQFH